MITITDIDGKSLKINEKDLTFRISVYGILKEKGKFLVQWNPDVKRPTLPGGGVELGESLKTALMREVKEETGLIVDVGKLIAIKEAFFMFKSKYVQSLLIFYEIEKVGGTLLVQGNGTDSEKIAFLNLQELKKEKMQTLIKEVLQYYSV